MAYNTPLMSPFRPIMCLHLLYWPFMYLLKCYNYLSYHYLIAQRSKNALFIGLLLFNVVFYLFITILKALL